MGIYVDIEKHYKNFDLKIKFEGENETVAFLGASGAGKSIILKCIAGIITPDRGRIVLNDRILFDSEKKINVKIQDRHTGYLFQNYALFPNMTVYENIRMGAKRGISKKETDSEINKYLEIFSLTGLRDRKPAKLSGGEQQRVALSRILISNPEIILLDEPFSALDAHIKFKLEAELCKIIENFKKPVVYVSHDRDEIYRVADSVAVVKKGRIETFGKKKDVFKTPETKYAAILTGCKNISPFEKISENQIKLTDYNLTLNINKEIKDAKVAGVRMHHIIETTEDGENVFICEVREIIDNPFSYTIMLSNSGEPFGMEIEKKHDFDLNVKEMKIKIDKDAILLLKD